MQEYYIQRCFELARLGNGTVSPNPIVGAVIVEDQRILGEGWHQAYGSDHAEINALNDVNPSAKPLDTAQIFVSLQPCSIQGKTPPCTRAIIRNELDSVIYSARDLTDGVKDVSTTELQKEGVRVYPDIQSMRGNLLVAPRNTLVEQQRPYVILKWAQTKDGYISRENESTAISNVLTKRYVHKLRAQVDAIVVGRKTVEVDNPSLTTRHYPGSSPKKVILGNSLKGIRDKQVMTDSNPALVFVNEPIQSSEVGDHVIQVQNTISDMLAHMGQFKFNQILVEGGSYTLQSFIDHDLWDEIQIITNDKELKNGVNAPKIPSNSHCSQSFRMLDDHIKIFHHARHIQE